MLKISTMWFRSQDGRSHPWVRRLEGDLFVNQWGMKIDERQEDTVIFLGQFSCISFGISTQFRMYDISLEGCNVD